MVRKCHSCGATSGLKQIYIEDCDNEEHEHFYNGGLSSICKKCYFDTCACDQDMHLVSECLEDKKCVNHEKSVQRLNNCDKLDYYYQPKKGVILQNA